MKMREINILAQQTQQHQEAEKLLFAATQAEPVFIGDRVTIYQDNNGGKVELGARVHLYGDTYIQTGKQGELIIGAGSVVIHDIPDNAIAVGSPARVVIRRTDLA